MSIARHTAKTQAVPFSTDSPAPPSALSVLPTVPELSAPYDPVIGAIVDHLLLIEEYQHDILADGLAIKDALSLLHSLVTEVLP